MTYNIKNLSYCVSVAFNRKEMKHQVESFQIGLNNKLPIANNAPNEGIDWRRLCVLGINVSEHGLNALEFFFVGFAGGRQHYLWRALFLFIDRRGSTRIGVGVLA